jgi:hypothetical protein
LKERKNLLERKADVLIRKNKEKVDSIANARQHELKVKMKPFRTRQKP